MPRLTPDLRAAYVAGRAVGVLLAARTVLLKHLASTDDEVKQKVSDTIRMIDLTTQQIDYELGVGDG